MTAFVTESERDTEDLGRRLAGELRAGSVLLISGPLGAGKTALVRGIASGLGCAEEDVSSPTFTIAQEYRGRVLLRHVDLYRLTPKEADNIGLDEMLDDGALAIEWPDRWTDAPETARSVTIDILTDTARRITVGP